MKIQKALFAALLAGTLIQLPFSHLFAQSPLPEQFNELPDPIDKKLIDWSGVKSGMQASFVSTDLRFPKSMAPTVDQKDALQIRGWRGEKLNAQVLLWTTEPKENIEVKVTTLSSTNNKLPNTAASTHFLRYVMTDEFGPGCGHRKPENFAASLAPDMLDNLTSYSMEGNTVRPVWIKVAIPHDAAVGQYAGTVEITVAGKPFKSLALEVEVIDQTLPEPKDWKFHLDQWQHPSAVARVEVVAMWSDAHFKAMEPVMKLLADAGQKVITATVNKDPWNVQTYDPYADMITWTKNSDGTWSYDYQVFDRWINFMSDLGINQMINCYSIIPWNNEIHYRDAKTGKTINVVAKPGTPVFEELWTPFLQDFSKHLKAKGWLEKTNIAIDEREREQMDAALTLMKKVSPELGVSYADNQKTYQRYPESEDISIAVGHPYEKQDILDRQKRGLNSTFYICCSDAFPNQFTFSDPGESTYLGWYALATGFDGLLRWAFNSWVENPLQDSRFRTWPAGDTYIVYPKARTSIRYERMLEGIQDYEKARIVLEKLKAKNDSNQLTALQQAIDKLGNNTRYEGWNTDLNNAKKLLNDISTNL